MGKKTIQSILDNVFIKLKGTNNKKMKEEILKTISFLKGNSKLERLEYIWRKKEEIKNSNVDKMSFQNYLNKIEEMIEKLIEQKENWVFEIKELRIDSLSNSSTSTSSYYSSFISQKMILVDENKIVVDTIENVIENYNDRNFQTKKELLMKILQVFQFIVPTKKTKNKNGGKCFLVPLLFSPYKPHNFLKFKNNSNNNTNMTYDQWKIINFENEWDVEYLLPFIPSSLWTFLFIRLRENCVGVGGNEREMQDEMYWMHGFSLHLIENDLTKTKTHLELEFIDNLHYSESPRQVSMKLTIKSNLNDMNLFFSSLHLTIQSFVKEWVVPDIYNKINAKISVEKENKSFQKIFKFYQLPNVLHLNDPIEQYQSQGNDKFKCFNCGQNYSFIDIKYHSACEKCTFIIFF